MSDSISYVHVYSLEILKKYQEVSFCAFAAEFRLRRCAIKHFKHPPPGPLTLFKFGNCPVCFSKSFGALSSKTGQ